MAEPGLQAQGIPAPPTSPTQAQAGQVPQQQDHHAPTAQQGQQVVHLNCSYFKPEF